MSRTHQWVDLGRLPEKEITLCHRENDRQRKKWGIQNHDPFTWLAFLTEEVGEVAKAMGEYIFRDGSAKSIQSKAIQVATLALKIAEMAGIREPKKGE